MGEKNIKKLQDDKRFVKNPYYINQFSFEEIISVFLQNNFSPKIIKDVATNNSELLEIGGKGSNIFRKQFIIVAEKE